MRVEPAAHLEFEPLTEQGDGVGEPVTEEGAADGQSYHDQEDAGQVDVPMLLQVVCEVTQDQGRRQTQRRIDEGKEGDNEQKSPVAAYLMYKAH